MELRFKSRRGRQPSSYHMELLGHGHWDALDHYVVNSWDSMVFTNADYISYNTNVNTTNHNIDNGYPNTHHNFIQLNCQLF